MFSFCSEVALKNRYKEYIGEVISSADVMGDASIFNKTGSFANANLLKTKSDFQRMLTVKPILFEDDFYTYFFEYSFTHIVVFIAGLVIVFTLMVEKKQGVRNIIFSSSKGRGNLVLHKAGALLLWAGFLVLFFYGTTLIVSAIRMEQNVYDSLFYPLQSIRSLTHLPWNMNIVEYLFVFWGYHTIILFLMLFLFWLLFFIIENQLLAMAAAMVIEVTCYVIDKLIPTNHPLSILHYLNPWYQLFENDFLMSYRNLNLWNQAVGKEQIVVTEWIIVLFFLLVIGILAGERIYPCKSSNRLYEFTSVIREKIKALMELYRKFVEKLPLTLLELYKILQCQRGVLIFIVAVSFFSLIQTIIKIFRLVLK